MLTFTSPDATKCTLEKSGQSVSSSCDLASCGTSACALKTANEAQDAEINALRTFATAQANENAALRSLIASLSARLGNVESTHAQDSSATDQEFKDLEAAYIAADTKLQDSIKAIALTPGPKGDKGEKGDKGDKGEKGESGETAPPASTLDTGLLAHYTFDDGTCSDSLGRYNGTPRGPTSFRPASLNSGALFVSGGGACEVDAFRNHEWGSAFSVCTWFKRQQGSGGYQGVVSTGYYTNGVWEIRMGAEDGGTMIGGTMWPQTPGLGDWWFGYQPKRLHAAQGSWHHVCMTWDGVTGKYFLDGVLADSTSSPGNPGQPARGKIPGSPHPLYIGKAGAGSGHENFNGAIDNVRLYERALTPGDVRELYSDKL